MAVHKLMIDDFDSVDYSLIAIHSSLEDYRLAYFINRELEIRLEKCPNDISFIQKESKAYFSRYLFEDEENDVAWNLIQNKNSIVSAPENAQSSLFSGGEYRVTTSVFFLPELKRVDYILKVDNEETEENVIRALLAVKYIATAYKIDHNKLKSKNNLIF
ncbi:IPExxxVDY family protein [Flavobacterium sp. Sd200]|uniref:IPExxxVDY family protein n=1 Tax=Flavobacterium sp. Sd200 TaxID=2692211 RepID=UPI00136D660D|nr:IPExxxVDY family protein [Flavobacterium sp. Sd200]MXN91372.1 IPExxxVDY family protein [Flavobacterium sp. Sd200]